MARWDQSSQQWRLEVKNTTTGEVSSDTADFLINGGGIIKYVSISYLSSLYSGTSGGTNARFQQLEMAQHRRIGFFQRKAAPFSFLG